MIPIKTNIVARRFAAVNLTLIVLCAVTFLYELQLGAHLDLFFLKFGLVPRRYVHKSFYELYSPWEQFLPFVTSVFLHGGWLHIIGNMWFLWVFGRNVEDRMGHFRYLFFYLLCGLAAGLIQAATVVLGVYSGLFTPRALDLPTIGASGAIAGIMGAYMVLFPRSRVLTLLPIFIFWQLVALPAYLFLGIWFVIQFFNGSIGLLAGSQSFGGVAWWAHIGGFAVGMIFAKAFAARPPRIG